MFSSYTSGWQRSFDYEGRATRSDYWWFQLLNIIVLIVVNVLAAVCAANLPDSPLGGIVGVVSTIYYFAQIFPSLSLSVRRMHDIGKGWVWILISLVPCIGGFWFLYLTIQPSVVG